MTDTTLRAEIYNGSPGDGMPITSTNMAVPDGATARWEPNWGRYADSDNPTKTLVLKAGMYPVNFSTGASPDPSIEPRTYLKRDSRTEVRIAAGHKLAAIPADI